MTPSGTGTDYDTVTWRTLSWNYGLLRSHGDDVKTRRQSRLTYTASLQEIYTNKDVFHEPQKISLLTRGYPVGRC